MFIELTRESNGHKLTISINKIIRFFPSRSGGCSLVFDQIIDVEETYEEIKNILAKHFIQPPK